VRDVSRGESIRNRFAVSAAFLAGVIAFVQSYRRWLHPFIDAGRDLYIPEQLRLGTTLYRDIFYYYPPLTPYLLAAVTAVTGSSLGAYIAIGLATALLTATAVWMIVRPLAGALAASCALLIFFSFSMAGIGGWGCNYFFPYAHAATFAMFFFLAAVASMVRGRWILTVLLLAAASWTKIEYAAFSMVLIGAQAYQLSSRASSEGPVWMGARNSSLVPPVPQVPRSTLGMTGWKLALLAPVLLFVAVNAVVLAIAIAIFGLDPLRANVLPPSLLGGASARAFYAHVTGTAAWQSNLALAACGAALIAVFVLGLFAWDRRPSLRAVIIVALVVTTILLANDTFFRAWTILQLALVPFAIRKPREPLALLLLVSLCASSRIYFSIVPSWYGFVFITPVVVLMVYVFFEWLPRRGVYRRELAVAWLLPFLVVAVSGLLAARAAYAHAEPVATKRGTYDDTWPERAQSVSALLRHLDRAGARELVVMPEGLAINYLAGVRTPLRRQTFTPVEIAGEEASIVAELEAKPPEYVAIVPRDVHEFGYRGFGVDYGREIVTWLRRHYVLEARFGAIVLLRRRQ
jgi:hypothetical protein